jgi:hypothetical protein
VAFDDDTMHKTVVYFMLSGEDFYTAWRHAAVACGDLSDLRIYRTPLIFYAVVALTGWAGDFFLFPLSVLCVLVAVGNVVLSFWTSRQITGSGRAGLAAALVQYAYVYNVIPRFMISLFAMPFLIVAVYFAWRQKPWLAGASLALSFLVKEVFAFAVPAFLLFSLARRRWRDALIYMLTFGTAAALYLLHIFISKPVTDLHMLFATTFPETLWNAAGFIWFGFVCLYYNIFLPITVGGFYPFSPIPPFLLYPLFLTILSVQVTLVWGALLVWIATMIRRRQLLNPHLAILGVTVWLVPIAIAATTRIPDFPLWWVDFGVWRWFAPSYVGFQILVAIGWREASEAYKLRRGQLPLSLVSESARPPEIGINRHGRSTQVAACPSRACILTCPGIHQRYKKRPSHTDISVAYPLGEGHQYKTGALAPHPILARSDCLGSGWGAPMIRTGQSFLDREGDTTLPLVGSPGERGT